APSRLVRTKVPGYKLRIRDVGIMLYGSQLTDANLDLEPDGWLVGDDMDEHGNPVFARVYVDSVMAKTESVIASPDNSEKPSVNTCMGEKFVQRLSMDIPSGKSKNNNVVPDDKGYFEHVFTEQITPQSSSSTVRKYVV